MTKPFELNQKYYWEIEHVSEGLYLILSRCGRQLWALTNGAVRKNHKCSACGRIILKGKERMFRPMTNLGNRYERICIKCLLK